MSKNLLITGATGNLGYETCKLAKEAGYQVIGTRERGDKRKVVDGVEYFDVDLTSDTGASDLVGLLMKKHDALHGAILLVGGFAMSNITNTTADDLMDMYELNFLTTFNTIKPVYQWMKKAGGGRIVVIGAKPAVEGGAAEVLPYALAKGSVLRLAAILNETGKQDGIVVSAVVPSIIDTPQNREAMPKANYDDWVKPGVIAGNMLHLISKEGDALRDPLLKLYGNA